MSSLEKIYILHMLLIITSCLFGFKLPVFSDENHIPEAYALDNQMHEAVSQQDWEQATTLADQLVRYYPSPRHYRQAGIVYAKAGLKQQAAEYLRRSIQNFETEAFELQQIFYQYRMAREWYDFLFAYHEQSNPKNPQISQRILYTLKAMRRYSEMLEFIETEFFYYENLYAFFVRELEELAKEPAFTNRVLESIARLLPISEEHPLARTELIHGQIKIWLVNEEFAAALTGIYELNEYTWIADHKLMDYIDILFEHKQYQELRSLLNEIKNTPHRVSNPVQLGRYTIWEARVLQEQGDTDSALATLTELQSIPNHQLQMEIAFELIQIHAKQGNFLQVLENTAILQFDSGRFYRDEETRYYYLEARLALNQLDGIESIFDTIKAEPDQYFLKALFYLFQGNRGMCLSTLESILGFENQNLTSSRALGLYQVLLQTEQDAFLNILAHFHRLLLKRNYTQLMSQLDQFVQIPSQTIAKYIQLELIRIFENQKHYHALEELLLYITHHGDAFMHQQAYFHLGKLYIEELNQPADGKRYLMDLLRQYPDSLFGTRARALLSTL